MGRHLLMQQAPLHGQAALHEQAHSMLSEMKCMKHIGMQQEGTPPDGQAHDVFLDSIAAVYNSTSCLTGRGSHWQRQPLAVQHTAALQMLGSKQTTCRTVNDSCSARHELHGGARTAGACRSRV